MTGDVQRRVAEVLAGHSIAADDEKLCLCGWTPDGFTNAVSVTDEQLESWEREYYAHQAAVLAAEGLLAGDGPAGDAVSKLDVEAIRARVGAFTPGVVMNGARVLGGLSDDDVSHGCVRGSSERTAEAVRNAACIQFKDVPALIAEVEQLRAQLADVWRPADTDTSTITTPTTPRSAR